MKEKTGIQFIISVIMLIVLSISVAGCDGNRTKENVNKDYSLVEIDGKHYLIFDENTTYQSSGAFPSQKEPAIQFSTMKQFKDAVTKGTLSNEQKQTVGRFAQDEEGRIKVCDFNTLFSLVTPKDGTVSYVTWQGEYYSFTFKTKKNDYGVLTLQTEDTYNTQYTRDYVNFFDNQLITVTKTEHIDGGNKEVIHYRTSVASFKSMRYSLSDGDKIFYIHKQYLLSHTNKNIETSLTVPYTITMYGEQNGQHYKVYMSDFQEDPSDEWLLSFGLKKYTE